MSNSKLVTSDDYNAVREQLQRICGTPLFSHADKLRDFFQYIVHKTIDRDYDALRQKALAVRVWGKDRNWRPRKHAPIVRAASTNLRKKLDVYYASIGANDPILISIPKGAYVAEFSFRRSTILPFSSLNCARYVSNAITAVDARTLHGTRHAMYYLEAALKDCADSPRIHALQALCHLNLAFDGQNTQYEIAKAGVVLDAIASAPNCWEKSYAQACLKTVYWEWDEATRLFSAATSLKDGNSSTDGWYTVFLISQLEFDKAINLQYSALSDDQGYRATVRSDLAFALMCAGRLDEAESVIRESLDILPFAHYNMHICLACLCEARGDTAGAVAAIKKIPLSEETAIFTGLVPLFEGLNGNIIAAERALAAMSSARESLFIPAVQIALAALGAGRNDEAVSWYKIAAHVDRDPTLIWINTMPFNRHLRGNQEFEKLVTQTMGLRFPD